MLTKKKLNRIAHKLPQTTIQVKRAFSRFKKKLSFKKNRENILIFYSAHHLVSDATKKSIDVDKTHNVADVVGQLVSLVLHLSIQLANFNLHISSIM